MREVQVLASLMPTGIARRRFTVHRSLMKSALLVVSSRSVPAVGERPGQCVRPSPCPPSASPPRARVRARRSSCRTPSRITRPDSLAALKRLGVDELLFAVPGVALANRQNPAQDPRVSIRGFGARSAFGVRGVRVLQDGVPAHPARRPDAGGRARPRGRGPRGGRARQRVVALRQRRRRRDRRPLRRRRRSPAPRRSRASSAARMLPP